MQLVDVKETEVFNRSAKMKSIVLMLMVWISGHSNYDTADMPLPEIVEMTPVEITKEAYTDNPNGIPEGGVDTRIKALYSHEDGPNGTIYIIAASLTDGPKEFSRSIENPVFQERLLHELIHHTQRMSGDLEQMPCRNFGEKEAYLLGGEFLKAINAEDPMPNRNFWAHIYSRC